MGTNYYIKKKERKVKEPDLHIGKNSWGWQFSFQAYEADDYYGTPELKSKEQWLEYIFLNSDSIYDEYNENISFNEFLEILEAKQPGSIRKVDGFVNLNHHIECSKTNWAQYSYLDPEGWSFTTSDFF